MLMNMEFKKEKLVRFYNDEAQKFEHSWEKVDPRYPEKPLISLLNPEKTVNEKTRTRKPAKFGRFRVFQENYELWREKILDPGGDIFLQWNRVFLFFCILSLFVDPLFFYTPAVVSNGDSSCMTNDLNLGIVITCFRTLADIFYVLHIVVKFQTAYVSPISRVFGRGELVTDRKMIAKRYLKSDFIIDLVAALPLPQIVLWFILPAVKSSHSDHTNNALVLIVLIQYFPRLYLIFPLSTQIIKSAGVVTRTAWAGAAYNLLLYMLASHVLGASWYLLSIERHATCWKTVCKKEFSPVKCRLRYLDCGSLGTVDRLKWENSTLLFNNCDPDNESAIFNYGIFGDAVTKTVVSLNFTEKYFYCLWWGLQNLSSYGQNLATSTSLWETLFAILIAILGLVLFAHLIGNMQTYLQSLTVRLEEWRLKQRDTEEWMKHRQLPQDLRQRVRHYVQYKWLATRGVDEESILQALPTVLRRDIQRHLCLDLVRRVPFFSQMDDQLLDAICERLASSLSTQGTYLVREGDPVTEMLFIIRGRLESTTTNGGRSGFFNSIILKPGDFCGEELLSWALLPKSTLNLPTSTRTVRALDEVEAFALQAEELKFVANQFRRLHSKKLQHTFRYYSHQWRTWGACFIQAAWRRHKKKRMEKNLVNMESFSSSFDEQTKLEEEEENDASSASSNTKQNLGITILASRFAANTRRGAQRTKDVGMPKLQKPEEPDFGMVADDD